MLTELLGRLSLLKLDIHSFGRLESCPRSLWRFSGDFIQLLAPCRDLWLAAFFETLFNLLVLQFLSPILFLLTLTHELIDTRLEFIRLRVYLTLGLRIHVVLRHVVEVELLTALFERLLIFLVKLLLFNPFLIRCLPRTDEAPFASNFSTFLVDLRLERR